ncbi:MAG: hypothetical protein RLZZ501_997 [Pseudomonadota bacterium]|jgi:2-keto-3-deoxy-L-rhamnonate aldolase RhmA
MTSAADIRATLRHGRSSIGAWLTLPSPELAECLAGCGFDWLAVDMEHGAIGLETAGRAFIAAERHGVAPFARLPSADPYLARRLLDQGCQGLIVPVVENAEDFRAFASHCLYPPAGKRGVGLSRGNQFGDSFDTMLNHFQPLLVPQIETRAGVAAAAAIAALPMVDALFLGPYDLSASLGQAGNFATPAFADAIAEVRHACAEAGKAAGIHQVAPVLDGLAARKEEGFRLIAFGTDAQAIRHVFAPLKA